MGEQAIAARWPLNAQRSQLTAQSWGSP